MNKTLRDELMELNDKPITYVGTIYGDDGTPLDNPDRTMPAVDWLVTLQFNGDCFLGDMIEHPSNTRARREGFYYQSGDIWYYDPGHTQEKVFVL